MSKEITEKELFVSFVITLFIGAFAGGMIMLFSIEMDLLVEKQTDMNEMVKIIEEAWKDCYLSIGLDDNQLYWKCRGFVSPIGYKCEELKVE